MMQPENPQRRKKSFLPEILIAGLILAGGGWFWSQNLAPAIPAAPETAAQRPPVEWKPAPDSQVKAARKVILAQLEAFKADDYTEASKYQASGLRKSFGSTERFRQAIKANYPQFANYKSVAWGESRMSGPMLQIQVVLTGKDDVQITALYSMMQQEETNKAGKKEKQYRVSGVNVESPQPSDALRV